MSFIICLGWPAWPQLEISRNLFRVVLGPASFWVLFHDFEKLLELALASQPDKEQPSV